MIAHSPKLTRHFVGIIFLCVIAACSTVEDGEDKWRFEDEAGPEAEAHDRSEPDAWNEQSDVEEEEPPLPNAGCSQFSELQWEGEEFAFALYRHLACDREEDENIIFSPVAIEIELGHLLDDLAAPDAQRLAENFGHQSPEEMQQNTQYLEDQLLQRVPKEPQGERGYGEQDYEVEEELERLVEAVGVEFFDFHCDDDECEWDPRNDRWSESYLSSEGEAAPTEPDVHDALGFVVRGQWERKPGVPYNLTTIDFNVPEERTIFADILNFYADGYLHTDSFSLFRHRVAGGELSFFIATSFEDPLDQVVDNLSVQKLQELLNSLELPHYRTKPLVRVPIFDLEELIAIGEPVLLDRRHEFTTRLVLGAEGMNFPEPVSLVSETRSSSAVAIDYDRFELNHPFFFFVYDHPTESIVLMGRIADPSPDYHDIKIHH